MKAKTSISRCDASLSVDISTSLCENAVYETRRDNLMHSRISPYGKVTKDQVTEVIYESIGPGKSAS